MLLVAIIDRLSTQKQHDDEPSLQAKVSYFFCQRSDKKPEIRNAAAVLRGLILMLHDHKVLKIGNVPQLHFSNAFLSSQSRDSLFDLTDTLIEMIRSFGKIVYLIIDSLDECDKEDQRHELFRRIIAVKRQCTNVRGLISSRTHCTVGRWFASRNCDNHFHIELSAQNLTPAVDTYIDRLLHLRWRNKPDKDTELRQQVRDKIQSKAYATFLWVNLIYKELEEEDDSIAIYLIENAPENTTSMRERASVCKLVKEGYTYYESFWEHMKISSDQRRERKITAREIFEILEKAIKTYGSAIRIAENMDPVFYMGALKGYIGKAEACLELSHTHEKGFTNDQKKTLVMKAENCLQKAMGYAKVTGDDWPEMRVDMESAILDARKAIIEKKCWGDQGLLDKTSENKEKLLCKLYGAQRMLDKKKALYGDFDDGKRSADAWRRKLDEAIGDLIGEKGLADVKF